VARGDLLFTRPRPFAVIRTGFLRVRPRQEFSFFNCSATRPRSA